MRLLGIDYGTKTTGFAIGEKGITQGLDQIRTKDKKTLINHIKKIVKEENIQKIIIGLPTFEKNKKQEKIVKDFYEDLKKETDVKTELVDEAGTSKKVFEEEFTKFSKLKKLKKKIHQRSAEEILKKYWNKLDTR